MADAADKAVDCQRKGAAVRHTRDDDNDKANGRLEEKIKGKNHFLFSIYLLMHWASLEKSFSEVYS